MVIGVNRYWGIILNFRHVIQVTACCWVRVTFHGKLCVIPESCFTSISVSFLLDVADWGGGKSTGWIYSTNRALFVTSVSSLLGKF